MANLIEQIDRLIMEKHRDTDIRPTLLVIDRKSYHTLMTTCDYQTGNSPFTPGHYQREPGPNTTFGLSIGITSNDSYFVQVA